jgi:hypothetical protein
MYQVVFNREESLLKSEANNHKERCPLTKPSKEKLSFAGNMGSCAGRF